MPRRRAPLRRGRPLTARERHDRRPGIPRGRVSGRARPDEPLATCCEAQIDDVCSARPEHRHHVRRRSQGGTDDASNTRDLCGRCHDWVHAHPAAAYQLSLLARAATDPRETT